jgi:hypothetical protein
MPKPSELVLSLHSALGVTIEQLEQIDRAENAQAMLDATVQEFEEVSARLQNTKIGIAQAEDDLKGKKHIIIDEAAKRLRDVNREIAEKRAELSAIQQQLGE